MHINIFIIKELLEFCKTDLEKLEVVNDYVYSKTGLSKISNIRPLKIYIINKAIEIDCYLLDKHRLFVLLDEEDYLNSNNIIKFSELEKIAKENGFEGDSNYIHNLNNNKILESSQLDALIIYSIKRKIINSYFHNSNVMVPEDSKLFPFTVNFMGKKYIFSNKKSHKTINSDCLFVYVKNELENNGQLFLNGKPFDYKKVNLLDLDKAILHYKHNSLKSIPSIVYKYRTFDKDNKDITECSEINKTNIINCGALDAIENNIIYFSSKIELNDPFDLDIESTYSKYKLKYENQSKENNDFKLFSSSTCSSNILLWSHYGDSHHGICLKYLSKSILQSIINDNNIQYCICGKVDYKDTRAKYKITESTLNYLESKVIEWYFAIKSLFRKYTKWNYEEEYRFIIKLNNENKEKGYKLTHNVFPNQLFIGNKFNEDKYKSYFLFHKLSAIKYELSINEYKLFIGKKYPI